MTYLLNLEEFSHHLNPLFAAIVNVVFFGSIVVYSISFFFGKIKQQAEFVSIFYFFLTGATILFSFIASSYNRFFYYKSTDPYFIKGSNIDLTPIYREQMAKSEVYLYVGLSMALFLLIFGALWRLKAKGISNT
mgnify:CR=1 FL=1